MDSFNPTTKTQQAISAAVQAASLGTGTDGDDIADQHIAVPVIGPDIEQRLPGTEIVPAEACRDHRYVPGPLHHGVIDRGRGDGLVEVERQIEA